MGLAKAELDATCKNACYPNLRNWSYCHGSVGLNMAEGIATLRH